MVLDPPETGETTRSRARARGATAHLGGRLGLHNAPTSAMTTPADRRTARSRSGGPSGRHRGRVQVSPRRPVVVRVPPSSTTGPVPDPLLAELSPRQQASPGGWRPPWRASHGAEGLRGSGVRHTSRESPSLSGGGDRAADPDRDRAGPDGVGRRLPCRCEVHAHYAHTRAGRRTRWVTWWRAGSSRSTVVPCVIDGEPNPSGNPP